MINGEIGVKKLQSWGGGLNRYFPGEVTTVLVD